MSEHVDINSLEDFIALYGEEVCMLKVSSFACPLNKKVEEFLKSKSFQTTRLGASVTYLVTDSETFDLVGYFTLVLKPFKVKDEGLSSRNRRMISRFAEFDEEDKSYTAALYLIAQIGKNYALPEDSRIDGADLMQLALQKLRAAQHLVGGKLVLVDRETDRPKLLKFYQQFNFKSWNVRHSKKDGIDYDQMLCVLDTAATGRAA